MSSFRTFFINETESQSSTIIIWVYPFTCCNEKLEERILDWRLLITGKKNNKYSVQYTSDYFNEEAYGDDQWNWQHIDDYNDKFKIIILGFAPPAAITKNVFETSQQVDWIDLNHAIKITFRKIVLSAWYVLLCKCVKDRGNKEAVKMMRKGTV